MNSGNTKPPQWAARSSYMEQHVQEIIGRRNAARAELREALEQLDRLGVDVWETPDGTRWEVREGPKRQPSGKLRSDRMNRLMALGQIGRGSQPDQRASAWRRVVRALATWLASLVGARVF